MRGLIILFGSTLMLQAAIDFDRDIQPILSDNCLLYTSDAADE